MPRTIFIALVAVAVAAAATSAAFVFGTPLAPPAPAPAASSGPAFVPSGAGASADSGGPPMGGDVIEGGEVPPPDPESPFAFQIPGCRCHSDDSAVVEEHGEYRLNQCAGCHRGR